MNCKEFHCFCYCLFQGLEPELRQEVWKFLLGYYDYKATDSERTVHRQQKVYVVCCLFGSGSLC